MVVTTTDFVGRQAELEAVRGRLLDGEGASIGVLCGFPGTGKSALAAKVAEIARADFPDGQIHVALTDASGAELDADDILLDVGSKLSAFGEGDAVRGLRQSGVRARVLVVLDGARRADQISPVLLSGLGGAVLVTSRSSLGGLVALHGAWIYRVGPLTPEDAGALLATSLGRDRTSAEGDAVREICALCQYHPLALRAVAARLQMRPGLTLTDCARWLADDTLDKISGGARGGLAITDLLHEALARLDPGLRSTVLRLARQAEARVWPDAARSVLAEMTPDEVASALGDLIDAGLLDESELGAVDVPELLRLYACSLPDSEVDRRAVADPVPTAVPPTEGA